MANALSGLNLSAQSYFSYQYDGATNPSANATEQSRVINYPDEDMVIAFNADDTEAALLFLEEGNYGANALCHHKVAAKLVNTDGSVTRYDSVSLFWIACRAGHTAVVSKMLSGQPELDELVQSENGTNDRTPLMVSCIHGHFEIAHLLLKAGANVTLKDSKGANVGAHVFIFMKDSLDKTELIKKLEGLGVVVPKMSDPEVIRQKLFLEFNNAMTDLNNRIHGLLFSKLHLSNGHAIDPGIVQEQKKEYLNKASKLAKIKEIFSKLPFEMQREFIAFTSNTPDIYPQMLLDKIKLLDKTII